MADEKRKPDEWVHPPKDGWTVETLVNALMKFPPGTPIEVRRHTDFEIQFRHCEPGDPKKEPFIYLD